MSYNPNTMDTTRIFAEDPIMFSTHISQMVFPSPTVFWRPTSVILVPLNPYHFSFIGASIIHFPINASFLFSRNDVMTNEVLDEIKRLAPTGRGVPAKVFLIGPFSENSRETLVANGLTTYQIGSPDVFDTAAKAAYFRLEVIPPQSDGQRHHLFIVSADTGIEALPATYYSAHHGAPILFVTRDFIPPATRWAIARYANLAFTIFGTENTISRKVEEEIRRMAVHVSRSSGKDPVELAVNFARQPETENQAGWGRNKPGMGDAFSYGTIHAWQKAVAGLLNAHMGKHTPLLLVERDYVPLPVKNYLLELNPERPGPPHPPFMHGYILGTYKNISYRTQVELEENLILRTEKH